MVREDLDASADDERHKEQVQEVLRPQHSGNPEVTAATEAGAPG